MKNVRLIEETLSDQKLFLLRELKKRRSPRREEQEVDIDSPLAQVVIGVRRSGKSTLCYNIIQNSGKTFAYVNFDDDRMKDYTAEDLNDVFKVLLKIYGEFEYLFLDEVQNIDGWHLFVNRLLRQGIHILLTGSNAKLLSSELATYLTGRHTVIELYPFSFATFCDWNQIDTISKTSIAEASIRQAFDDYMRQGGFPELLTLKNKQSYISELLKNIITRDIVQRYHIRYPAAFERLTNHLLNIAPAKISGSDLQELFHFRSNHTVENYIGYLQNAYLIRLLPKYSTKSRERQTGQKVYAIDMAMMDKRENAFSGDNLGWRLETVVYIELLRRYKAPLYDIYYYNEGRGETDFVLCKGNQTELLIQVCYDISEAKTLKRELSGFEKAVKATHCHNCLLITDHEYGTQQLADGTEVTVVPAYDYLLGR